ncbi:antibiotic biosynthesis monooxygenase [Streptomyces sp. NPDC012623]|uniref:antibiotic biosynthesis monooxygenase n=1 Tax=unclassified Streptomyces TaxID=2593676 RepID=UPI0036AC0443
MSVQLTTVPDPARSGVGAVMVSTWRLMTPARQRAAVEAVSRVWRAHAWPDAGLLSYSVAVGEDGETLLNYTQWSDAEVHRRFARASRDERVAEIDAAVPDIERLGLGRYEPYRSAPRTPGDTRVPGCIVIVEVEFDDSDPANRTRWVDAVLEALATDSGLPPGGISAHFHLSTDGTRVLNYAEWESAEAHVAALCAPGEGVGGPTEQWARVRNHPGLKGSSVKRYTPAFCLGEG